MPIPRNEFDNGEKISRLHEQILEFLYKHRESAYTTTEIVREVIRPDENTLADVLRFGGFVASVTASLEVLVVRKKVIGKIVQVGSVRDVYFTVSKHYRLRINSSIEDRS